MLHGDVPSRRTACPLAVSLQGYAVFLAALYTMIGLMMVAVALSAWVAWCFRNRSFPAVWWVRAAGGEGQVAS